MAAKLTFQDVFNNEMAPEKFINSPLYFSTGAINPIHNAPCGSLYINTVTGGFFLNVSSPTPGVTWVELSNNSANIEIGHTRTVTQNGLSLTALTGYIPTPGDIIGTFGVGTWSNSGNLNHTYKLNNGCGTTNQALNTGGDGAVHKYTELFNGATWASSSNLNINRYNPVDGLSITRSHGANIFGSVNGAVCVGGYDGAAFFSSCELYNGSTWTTGSGNVGFALTGFSGMAAAGTSFSGVIIGDDYQNFRYTTKFNGSVWTKDAISLPYASIFNGDSELSASGSVNSVLINSHFEVPTFIPTTYLHNGATTFVLTNNHNFSFVNAYTSGNPYGAYKYGGRELVAPYNASKKTEIFNGVTYIVNGDMNVARIGSQTKGPGSAVSAIAMGGRSTDTGLAGLNSSEIYTETINQRKIYSQYIKSYNQSGIFFGINSMLNQGRQGTILYPANKYLVINKNTITSIGNQDDISAGYGTLQVSMSGSLATYSISSSPSLQIIPGNIAYITSGGGNPLTANNTGIFIVKSIILASNTITVINSAGTSQNPGTGTIKLVTTMVCVDYINSDDIVIGSTDDNGILTIDKMFKNTNYFSKVGI